ncbi:SWIM zinc finger family protein [Paractinoplanes lichenicola]|uniref:SWIM zinc finger family protein n=1 Tax=Paractinoplanes lichenicola TaxID=2802976 RepID=A0ABS1VJI4_9ACTN|nr:SWIM zinc finger family protein [Actinoplanes lichenicola]MBL7254324.1 SWIM zinc finger family protein [Actinoplanes lichenicola]
MPVERWSAAQVETLAPDAPSVKAARGLSFPASWSATGRLDDILWGQLRNYQVCVDLTGPAFKCSCPSRKIPCKHSLALLMLWAESDVADAPAAEFAKQWQAARAARAAKPKTAAAAPDPAAAAKRVEQRAERVAGGMTELSRWLDDQIRQGLAGAQRSGPQPFEAMAARLVDAQAPAAAGAVRRLGSIAGIGPHWADRLLGELALLRLLVAGYERLADLPPELAATVRSRIGFPVATDDVLAGPRVTDRWQVLGQVESDDGALTTRRTWLRGEASGRFALVLSFAAPGQPMAADLVAGTEFRGELAFYPGSAPLRALVADKTSAAEPFREPSGAVPLATALSGYTATVAAEPWRFDAPVLLAGVVPSGDAWLVDESGAALPLAPGHREPWWLLAAAGGRPATVAAEWSPTGLRPLAAWVEGEFVAAAPPVPGPAPARHPELPPELLASALVGTNRRPWTGEVPLLEAAAVALTRHRAGVLPGDGHEAVPATPGETEAALPTPAGARLLRILGGAVPGGAQLAQELLSQWLAAAAERGGHVPPSALPALLDAGRRNSIVRPALARVAGRRGAWLAGMRADWRWLRDETTVVAMLPDWHTGSSGERVGHLTRLRETDPAQARELLISTWAEESSDDRARFVGALATGLSTDDDPFLEAALDDRRKEVREAALDLLRRLPGSQLRSRMAERALTLVQRERRLLGADRLVVTPPEELDAALRRDGVASTPARGIGVSAWLLEEVVAATPLDTWSAPATMLRLARGNDWETPLLHGWAKAAVVQQDPAWAGALLADVSGALRESVRWDLHLVLPPAELGRLAADALRRDDGLANRLLAIHPGHWPEELSVAVLETIAHRARTDRHSWQLGELCREAGLAMPPAYAELVSRLALQLDQEPADPSRVRPVAELARTLTFRQEMFAELTTAS